MPARGSRLKDGASATPKPAATSGRRPAKLPLSALYYIVATDRDLLRNVLPSGRRHRSNPSIPRLARRQNLPGSKSPSVATYYIERPNSGIRVGGLPAAPRLTCASPVRCEPATRMKFATRPTESRSNRLRVGEVGVPPTESATLPALSRHERPSVECWVTGPRPPSAETGLRVGSSGIHPGRSAIQIARPHRVLRPVPLSPPRSRSALPKERITSASDEVTSVGAGFVIRRDRTTIPRAHASAAGSNVSPGSACSASPPSHPARARTRVESRPAPEL